nr:M2 family metallopeptidase [Acidobacteriota bacterium]
MSSKHLSALALAALVAGSSLIARAQTAPPAAPPAGATAAEASQFLEDANRELLRLWIAASRAGWVQGTYITPDTEAMAAQANEAAVNAATAYAKEARRFDRVPLPPLERRQMDVLKNSLTMSAPPDPKDAEAL